MNDPHRLGQTIVVRLLHSHEHNHPDASAEIDYIINRFTVFFSTFGETESALAFVWDGSQWRKLAYNGNDVAFCNWRDFIAETLDELCRWRLHRPAMALELYGHKYACVVWSANKSGMYLIDAEALAAIAANSQPSV